MKGVVCFKTNLYRSHPGVPKYNNKVSIMHFVQNGMRLYMIAAKYMHTSKLIWKKTDKYNLRCLGDLQKGILRLCGSNPGVREQHSGQMLIQFATWTNLNWYKYDHSIKWLPGSGHPRRGLYWHNAFITRLVLTHVMERLRKHNIATETSVTFHSDQNTLKHNLVT